MKHLLLTLLLAAGTAAADTTVAPLPTGTWTLMRSATNVQTGYATKEACWAAAEVDAEARKIVAKVNYRCRTDLIFAVTYKAPTIPPQPAAETQTVACTSPLVGSWTQVRTYFLSNGKWVAGDWTPSAAPAGACVTPVPPKPADDTQTVACPSGTTGSWSQTRTYSLVSNAWVAGAWTPAAAPSGACTAVVAQTWAKMASEGGSFNVATASSVRFGAGSAWITKTLSGTVQCTNTFFGSDPAVNVVKECDQLGGVSPTPVDPPVDPTPTPLPDPIPGPVNGLQVNRTSCTAPCAVLFDATAMGDFRATYSFDFGDPNSGAWAISGKSKNTELGGPIAAHVYMVPGAFKPVVNGVSVTITVADANVTYAGTKTVCVSPAKDYTDCPAGAAQVTALPALPWAGKRVLLHTGEKFGDIQLLDGNIGVQVGSYGSGAKPVVASVGIGNWRPTTTAFPSDVTVMDLNVSNQISQSLGNRVLILRNDVHLTPNSGGIPLSIGEVDYWYRGDPYRTVPQSAFYNAHQIFLVENNALGTDTATGVAGFWGEGSRIAMLGNRFGKYQMHSARFSGLNKGVISHNELQGISADGIRLALKLHSNGVLPYSDTLIADSSGRGTWASSQIVIGNNLFGNAADNNAWTVEVGPQNNTVGEGVEDVVVENNRFARGKNTSRDFVYVGRRITTRGNTVVGGGAISTGTDTNTELPASWMGPNYIGN